MFKLLKRKTPVEKLNIKYLKLMKEAHDIAPVSRKESDRIVAEAQAVLNQIEKLKN